MMTRIYTTTASLTPCTSRPAITVYGASAEDIDPEYKAAAYELGALLAGAGYTVVNGGGALGLMGAVNNGALSVDGGCAVGVIPQFMADRGWGHKSLTEMVIAADMHDRKAYMARVAQAVIAMPGGIGTFEEVMEIMTWRKLNLYAGQVILLNTRGYYDPLVALLQHAAAEGFMGPITQFCHLAPTPADALALLT